MSFKEQIINELVKLNLQKWKVCKTQLSRREFYLLANKNLANFDQIRSVTEDSYLVYLAVEKSNGLIGSASKKLTAEMDLVKEISTLHESAKLSEEKPWQYLDEKKSDQSLNTCYPGFLKDFEIGSQLLADKLKGKIEQRKGHFNSAELFISLVDIENTFSNGLTYSEKRSKIYTEVCFSSGEHEEAQEYLVSKMGAHPEQISFEKMIDESIECSKALEHAQLPLAGEYDVVIDAEVFGQLVHDSLQHLHTSQKYYKMPFKEVDSDFIKDYSGIEFEIESVVSDDFLFGSKTYDSQANTAENATLVKSNKVLKNISSPQMGQYLSVQSGPSLGNIHIHCNSSDLISDWHKKKPVLEILQFSGLFSSPKDLSFSSEIRLARMWTPGSDKPVYIKGGSLNAKVTDNFKCLALTGDKVSVNLNENSLGYSVGYVGPSKALLNDVSITS